jgi:hypothetical protein
MLYTHTLLVVVVKRDERRRHLLQMIRFEMRRFYNGRYSPFIACGRLQSWPSKKSFPSCQPNSTLIRSSSSLVSQPGSIDLNLLYIPQHRRAIYFYTFFFKEKIVSCIIFFVWTDQEQIRWAQCARLEKKERAVELNRIVKIKKK